MDKMLNENDAIEALSFHLKEIIKIIGEDPDREGLLKTPVRAAKAFYYATQGYRQNPAEIVSQAIFDCDGSKLVVVKDIEFYSFCEHHILPFFGKISIGYIPGKKMVGLSKLARLVNVYCRRLQVQERLTTQVCTELMRDLDAKGVMVKCTAQHLCMKMRGVEKQDSLTTTLDYCGEFENNSSLRTDFLNALRD
ncbi:MAG: GTP cyclohydrolase I FolE [Muribaculaceae bacterium]|nr:GTP cyclohydrolase I FolE [Muribaculaceae bacterium]